MIVSFSIENWMSFRDRVTLSMVASRERQHGERVARLGKYQMRLLPAAAVYGGNASGKTNLFKALAFARIQVVRSTPPDTRIPLRPFLLERGSANKPSRFWFELLIDEVIYAFSFAMTREKVLEERLVRVSSSGERQLYDRRNGQIAFDKSLEEDPHLRFAFQGTRDNQLFLTNSVSQKLQQFRPVHAWFKDTLRMVAPDARGGGVLLFDEDHPLTMTMNEMLADLDTGITHLGSEQVPSEKIQLPEALEGEIQEQLGEGQALLAEDEANNQFLLSRKDGELVVKKRVTVHRTADGTEARFEVSEESDGSQRLINLLLPAFLDLSLDNSKRVYVIDEVDRSLHTLLTRRLLEDYLASRSGDTRTQLLLTTHDVLLMDQRWLRRDEMWVTERDASGVSSLFSFSEYRDVRYDKDIRKSYLQGRLGGIPRIVSPGSRHIGTKKT